MTFVRPARRVLIAAVSLSALLLAAACGGGGTEAPPAASASGDAEYDKKGPITYVAGKDATGYMQKRIDSWNTDHPDEKVTFLELPESADQQRQQMIQNAQIKSDKQTLLSMDVVWTAEFAANGIVDALPEGAVDTSPFLPATRGQRDLLQQALRLPERPPTAACSTTARICWTRPAWRCPRPGPS